MKSFNTILSGNGQLVTADSDVKGDINAAGSRQLPTGSLLFDSLPTDGRYQVVTFRWPNTKIVNRTVRIPSLGRLDTTMQVCGSCS